MAVTIAVDEDYGYVILVGVLSMLFSYVLGGNVMRARKRYGVKYPIMYSDTCMEFNCIQRVHGNYLETYPIFLVLLFCGGLAHPGQAKVFHYIMIYGETLSGARFNLFRPEFYCAIAGIIYLLGRVVYAIGYSTGDPNKRIFGLFFYLGIFYLLYSTLELGVRLLRWV